MGEMIRNILFNYLEYPTAVPTFWLDKNKFHLPQRLGIVRKPEKVKCFYVNMEIKNQLHGFMATVLIPNPTETGWEVLKEVDLFLKTHKDEKLFEFFTLPVELPNNISGYTSSWQKFGRG
jgi:hypothetical protein